MYVNTIVNNAELLTAIEAAISQLLSGNVQSYSISGRSYAKLDLGKLWEMRTQVSWAVQREQGGMVSVAQFRGRD